VVREFGNLSFSRVYDAGHLVPAYQPETAFTVFSRIIEGTEIGQGRLIDLATDGSLGANATHENVASAMASPVCYLRAVNATCDTDQKNMLVNRTGVIINGVLYDDESEWKSPDASITTVAGMPETAPMGMYTSPPPVRHQSATSNDELSEEF
jgi:Serine carboxypeptidase